jgi:hypothetical protein
LVLSASSSKPERQAAVRKSRIFGQLQRSRPRMIHA